MIRRNLGVILTATALLGLLLIAFILSLAQHKLPELGLELLVYLFAISFGVFVVERMLAWREERRWLAAKNWLYMILLETIDDLLKELLPASVPQKRRSSSSSSSSGLRTNEEEREEEEGEEEEEIAVYEVGGERIHFGEVVAYSPLRLLVSPDERELQSHLRWYIWRLQPQRYAELARDALSDAREQIRDMLASSGQLLEAEITAMLMSLDQAIAAAMRHLESATRMREEKLGASSSSSRHLDDGGGVDDATEGSERHPTEEEADDQLDFVSSIIVESVVDSAMKPKAWLEEEIQNQEGRSSPLQRLRGSTRAATTTTRGSTKQQRP